MASKTILQPNDVLRFTQVSKEFPVCSLALIRQVERAEAYSCIGFPFYERLLADLVDHSGAPQWSKATTYGVGDVVLYNQVYYVATASSTGIIPSNALNYWDYAPRFTTQAYEDLFIDGALGSYLAHLAVRQSLGFGLISFGANGIVAPQGNTFDSPTEAMVKKYQNNLDAIVNQARGVMSNFVLNYPDGGNVFSGFLVPLNGLPFGADAGNGKVVVACNTNTGTGQPCGKINNGYGVS